MAESDVVVRTEILPKVARPPLYKVLLHNDDYTPREYVIIVLGVVFRMGREAARVVMLTAHQRGCCVVAVFTQEVAETKVKQACDMARAEGYPLMFTTEPET